MTFGRPCGSCCWHCRRPCPLGNHAAAARRWAAFRPWPPAQGALAGAAVAGGLLPALLLAVAILIYCRPLRQAQPKQERMPHQYRTGAGRFRQHDVALRQRVALRRLDRGHERVHFAAEGRCLRAGDFRQRGSALGAVDQGPFRLAERTPFLRPESLPPQFDGTEIGKAMRYCLGLLPRPRRRGPPDHPAHRRRSADLGPPSRGRSAANWPRRGSCCTPSTSATAAARRPVRPHAALRRAFSGRRSGHAGRGLRAHRSHAAGPSSGPPPRSRSICSGRWPWPAWRGWGSARVRCWGVRYTPW